VRYEDFLFHPVAVLKRIFAFFGAAVSGDHVRDIIGNNGITTSIRPVPPSGLNHEQLRDWESRQPIYNDAFRWTRVPMSEEDKSVFKACKQTGELLALYQYPQPYDW
jgi:hypothetical protein